MSIKGHLCSSDESNIAMTVFQTMLTLLFPSFKTFNNFPIA